MKESEELGGKAECGLTEAWTRTLMEGTLTDHLQEAQNSWYFTDTDRARQQTAEAWSTSDYSVSPVSPDF